MTFEEAAESKRTANTRLAERNRQRQQDDARIAAQARRIMSIASPALPTNPYIQRMQISAYGLHQTRLGIVVPMQDASGALRNVQTVFPDGRKAFLKGPVMAFSQFWATACQDGRSIWSKASRPSRRCTRRLVGRWRPR